MVCWDLCPSACYFFRPALIVLVWGVFWFVCVPVGVLFFSSSMADVALWLGPYMSISSKTSFVQGPKRPENAGKSQQTNHHTDQPDPQIPQPDLRFVKRNSTQKGARAQTKTPIKGFAIGHSGLTTASHSVPVGVLVVLRVCVGLWRCCFLPLFLCVFLLLLVGLLRFGPFSPGCVHPLSCHPSVGPLVPSGPASVLLVPPSAYLVVFATARLSSVDGLAPVFTSSHGNKGFGVLPHVAGVVQVLVSEDYSGFHG